MVRVFPREQRWLFNAIINFGFLPVGLRKSVCVICSVSEIIAKLNQPYQQYHREGQLFQNCLLFCYQVLSQYHVVMAGGEHDVHDQSTVFQFNDSALEISMSELDISFGSSGSPSPRLPTSRRPDNDQRDWRRFLRKAEEEDMKQTIINDNIHGHIVVPAVCQAIIDTPQFDRLRGLRQLGSAHYVYPAAKHSR